MNDTIAAAWRARAEELSNWTLSNLVNRTDIHGRYLPLNRRNKGSATTAKRGITREDLAAHFRADEVSKIVGLHTTSPDNTSRWGAFDLDEKKGDSKRASLNLDRALALVEAAARKRLQCVLEDSNGAGAYHLWILFDEPVRTSQLVAVLTALRDECGIPADEVEIFPKQAELKGERKSGNWVRLPGRHHDGRPHWSKLRRGLVWLTGAEAVEFLLAAPVNDLHAFDEALKKLPPPESQPEATQLRRQKLEDGDGRHNMLRTEARRLWRPSSYMPEELGAMLHALNRIRCSPPLPDRELEALVEWVTTLGVEDEIEDVNRRFGVIQRGSQVAILDTATGDSGYSFLRPEAFHTLLANRHVIIKKKRHEVSKLWLQSKHRREFTGLKFDPTDNAPSDKYNLWRGFAVTPDPSSSCSVFCEHLRENICCGVEEHYLWVLGWFAALFQDPLSKVGTALVLRGKQGTGKTIVGKIVGHLLGTHYALVATQRLITGNFNAHQQHILLLQADEAFYAGDKRIAGALKDLVTNDTFFVEPKFIDPFPMPNLIRLLVTSNEEWTIPAGFSERRFTVLDVGERNKQDNKFFARLLHQMEHEGGYGALLHLLLTHQYDANMLRSPLETDALREEQDRALDTQTAWWLQILSSGELPGDRQGTGESLNLELHPDYLAYCKRVGDFHPLSEVSFGRWLAKVAPFTKREHRVHESVAGPGIPARMQVREFPSLAVCRKRMDERMGRKNQWGEPMTWCPWVPARELY